MAPDTLVANRDQAIDNILRYQVELDDDRHGDQLRKLMSRVRAWYSVQVSGGRWLFAPSKFVGYADNTAKAYVLNRAKRDGRKTERVLEHWFRRIEPAMDEAEVLKRSLLDLLWKHGHRGPNERARILVPKVGTVRAQDGARIVPRVRIDPAICSGRPHIRGTRVRVSDVLQLLASGASISEILHDYPCLEEADLRAALAYGATAIDHRVVLAA